MDPDALRGRLTGGDRRSIGCSETIVADVLGDRRLLAPLIEAMTDADPFIAMRAADAAEKISRGRPDWLVPHKDLLVATALTTRQREVQWHLAMIWPRLDLTEAECDLAETMLMRWLGSDSRIVRVEALDALVAIAARSPARTARASRIVDLLAGDPSPAMRARVRRLRARGLARGSS